MSSLKNLPRAPIFTALAALAGCIAAPAGFAQAPSTAAAPTLAITSIEPGPTPFVSFVTIAGPAVDKITSVAFSVVPKASSTTLPVSATYARQRLTTATAHTLIIPVFGLYANRTNTVRLTYSGHGLRGSVNAQIVTAPWDNSLAAAYAGKTDVVPRNNTIRLNFSFFMLKAWAGGTHPVVMDTDGEVRWCGTAGPGNQGSIFMQNGFYVGDNSLLRRIELDGSASVVADYSALGYWNFHHNIDPGKTGMLIDINHDADIESEIIEADASGNLLNSWNLATILEDAIVAGGEDPSSFVRTGNYDDWFHNNAATYWKAKDSLVVSSRENFVIGIGYETKEIKWILGDTNKAWFQNFKSLRKYALTLTGNSIAPIGQHAVSITANGQLMLFDDGLPSYNQSPAGISRDYSAPRRYTIDDKKMEATEVWNFEHGQAIYSPICSSIYQDNGSFLIDYAAENWGQDIRLLGLDNRGRTAFEYVFNGLNWSAGWNAIQIHLENLHFH